MSPELPRPMTLDEFLQEPVQPGSLRVMWCTFCGCVTGIRTADGAEMGDPAKHTASHAKKKGWFRWHR